AAGPAELAPPLHPGHQAAGPAALPAGVAEELPDVVLTAARPHGASRRATGRGVAALQHQDARGVALLGEDVRADLRPRDRPAELDRRLHRRRPPLAVVDLVPEEYGVVVDAEVV